MTNEAKMKDLTTANSAPKRRKIASLDRRKARSGWLFVLPFVIGFALIYLPMIVDSLNLSFNKIHIISGGGYYLEWVGFENYSDALFKDPNFMQTLVVGLQNLAFQIPAILIFSLFMAVLLNQKMAGRALFRAIFFIPVILATGIMETIEASDILGQYMEGTSGIDTGSGQSAAAEIVSAVDVERLFANMKVGTDLTTYVTTMVNNIYDIVNRSGVQMLIFLSGLQSISPAIYESCKMDGATAWETFWKITFPMVSPMILVNAVYTVIDSFTTSDNVVMSYIKTVYDKSDGQVLSSAMSWMYFLIIALIVGIIVGVLSMFVFYSRRND